VSKLYKHQGAAVRRSGWRLAATLAAAAVALAGCERKAPEPTETIKSIMDTTVNPSGEFLFRSIIEMSDERGVTRKEPKTEEDWALVRHHLDALQDGVRRLSVPGLRAAGPGDQAANPLLELQPVEINKLLDTDHPDFLRRANRLSEAATAGSKAAAAKDVDALFAALTQIDHACESCHLRYWYPKDERARAVAKDEGVPD
jgi:hypothetical protein